MSDSGGEEPVPEDRGAEASGHIGGLPRFNPNGDPATLDQKWKRYKRAFKIYLNAKNITNADRKLALLLHSGGMEFQDLYYTLIPETEEKSYDESITILDGHFAPQTNEPFERHLFRQLQQEDKETIAEFHCRLKRKSTTCNFHDSNEAIRDQLIDKCRDQEMRRKFLEKSGVVTLTDLLTIAKAFEAVDSQMKAMSALNVKSVNTVKSAKGGAPRHSSSTMRNTGYNSVKAYGDKQTFNKSSAATGAKRACYRCGKFDHFQRDPNCPGRKAQCTKCGFLGHYAVKCRSGNTNPERKKPHKAYLVENEVDYAFNIVDNIMSEGTVSLHVGGVVVDRFLIDSGASCNLIDSGTWDFLKHNGVKCKSRKIQKKLFAYAQVEPIETVGIFECNVVCDGTKLQSPAEFVVVKGSGKSILGKTTAEALNVLRVGPPNGINVYSIAREGDDSDIFAKYPDVFEGVGKLKGYELDLHIDDKVKPVAQPVRRLPFGLREKVDEKLDELIENDIIEEVSGPTRWVSALVVVPKSGGDVRICVDMRRANEAIIRERHPIPTIEEVLYDLNGATVFSKLDMKWGFHQIVLSEGSREITTFVTHRALYRYKRLGFGINSAPEKYQKIIKDVLQGCRGVANIADDLIIYGCGLEDHDRNLVQVLERLKEANLTLNRKKCEFRLPKLTFFGHDLGREGISPSEEKVASVLNTRAPETVAEVRSFLGLVQYSAKFLPDLAQVAEPLRRLTRKNVEFIWGPEQEKSFKELKDLMTRVDTLAYFKADCKTRIVADAGPTGVGAVLTQLHGDNWRVISYASRSLTDVERRYSQTEKEALALVWSCERFNLYVLGRKFELETDHKPLECIYTPTSKPCARIERWVLRLQSYDYKVVYRPGRSNIADALSRLNSELSSTAVGTVDFVRVIAELATPVAMTPKEIEVESEKDSELTEVRQYLKSGDWTPCKLTGYAAVKSELCQVGQLVLRGTRIVVPHSLRKRILELAHEGHQGIVKTKERLRVKVWWPKMDYDVEKLCKSCHSCQVVGGFNPPEPMCRVEPPSGPWQDLAIDLMGPLPTGESILVVVDYFSRFFEIEVMRSVTSKRIIDALGPMFARWGFPFSVKSDNGPQFISEEFEQYMRDHGIEHRVSPPLWPQANGEVERQNRSLLKSLKISNSEGRNWREELYKFLVAYRSTPHSSTGVTPTFLMQGRELRSKLPELRRENSIKNEGVREHDWERKLSGKLYSDTKRGAKISEVTPGSKVLLKNTKERGKLTTNFETIPYTVKQRNGNELVVSSKDGAEYRRNASFVKAYVDSQDSAEPVVPVATNIQKTVTCKLAIPSPKKDTLPQRASTRRCVIPERYGDWKMD